MMGERQVRQEALFCGFSLEEHVPADHLLRAIDRFVELNDIRRHRGVLVGLVRTFADAAHPGLEDARTVAGGARGLLQRCGDAHRGRDRCSPDPAP